MKKYFEWNGIVLSGEWVKFSNPYTVIRPREALSPCGGLCRRGILMY